MSFAPFPSGREVRRVALPAMLALLCLAACTPRFDPRDLETISDVSEVSRGRAMVVPAPGSASILNVLESRYANAYVQELLLETHAKRPGQNRFRVTFMLPGDSGGQGSRELTLEPLSPELIQRELSEQFPDVAMRTSSYFVQNRYGPFGFATGRASTGDVCLYAWQTVSRNRYVSLIDGQGGKIDIRLAFCDADASEADLLGVMFGFTVNAYLSRWHWQPYEEAPVLPAEFGQPGTEVRPANLLPANPVPTPAPQVRRAPRRAAADAEEDGNAFADDLASPLLPPRSAPAGSGGYPTVPLPP
ncbi:MAG: cellulose biosynthesis protein BcsN [Pseudochelatococcus sp.]|uniref:cellulose biosynthesis protein BcsN n=1 Tax=Pseudochelatococcus sp. TaxID=2020869 RepID=UPI003D9396F5